MGFKRAIKKLIKKIEGWFESENGQHFMLELRIFWAGFRSFCRNSWEKVRKRLRRCIPPWLWRKYKRKVRKLERKLKEVIKKIVVWLESEEGQQFKLELRKRWARFTWFFTVNWYVERLVVYLPLCVLFAVLTFYLVPSFMGMDFSGYYPLPEENIRNLEVGTEEEDLSRRVVRNGFGVIAFVSDWFCASSGLAVGLKRWVGVENSFVIERGSGVCGLGLKRLFRSLRFCSLFRVGSLVDLFVVDRLGEIGIVEQNRFLVVYVLSVESQSSSSTIGKDRNFVLPARRVQLRISQGVTRLLPTVSDLWAGAEWAEREVWDMFGVRFDGHPDLRRLLTDYGFRGFPLRKEFPTYGFKQVRYDESTESVVYERLSLTQQEREVQIVNPWNAGWSKVRSVPRLVWGLDFVARSRGEFEKKI